MVKHANLLVQFVDALEAGDDKTVDELSKQLLGQPLMKLGKEAGDEHVARLLEVFGGDNDWISEMNSLGPVHTPLDALVINTNEAGFEELATVKRTRIEDVRQ